MSTRQRRASSNECATSSRMGIAIFDFGNAVEAMIEIRLNRERFGSKLTTFTSTRCAAACASAPKIGIGPALASTLACVMIQWLWTLNRCHKLQPIDACCCSHAHAEAARACHTSLLATCRTAQLSIYCSYDQRISSVSTPAIERNLPSAMAWPSAVTRRK